VFYFTVSFCFPEEGENGLDRQAWYARLESKRIIASVKRTKDLEKAMEADVGAVVLSVGNIGVIQRYVDLYRDRGIPVFIHLERIGGLSQDKEGIDFLAAYVKPTGIVSTRNSLIKWARRAGLLTIQRLFLVDSDSIRSGILSLQETQPDAAEMMPALLPHYIPAFQQEVNCPIIAGGLITRQEQMTQALEHGAIAVSLGSAALWKETMPDEGKQSAVV